jgi:hypothetical protein
MIWIKGNHLSLLRQSVDVSSAPLSLVEKVDSSLLISSGDSLQKNSYLYNEYFKFYNKFKEIEKIFSQEGQGLCVGVFVYVYCCSICLSLFILHFFYSGGLWGISIYIGHVSDKVF